MCDEYNEFYVSDWFLNLIDSSDRNLSILEQKLNDLTKYDLVRFQFEYLNATLNIYPNDEIKFDINDEEYIPSYDDRINFSGWVISLGDEFISSILKIPRDLAGYFREYYSCPYFTSNPIDQWRTGDNVELEGVLPETIAYKVYREKFDDDLWEIVDDLVEDDDKSIIAKYKKNETYKIYQRV